MSQSKQCSAEGCEKVATHKGWCLLHYARWRRHGDPLIARLKRGTAELEAFRTQTKQCARCAQDFSPLNRETEETWAKRRFCSCECSRTSPLGRYAIDVIQVKVCVECGKSFTRPPQFSAAQWDERRCCSARCGNALGARGRPRQLGDLDRKNYGFEWARRQAMPKWAAWWEDQRRQEDIYDLAARLPVLWQGDRSIAQGGPVCHLSQAPRPRRFLCGWCPSCGNAWTYYAKRAQSRYCAECNEAHHRRPANRRARQNGALYEVIIPRVVFERDGYRCQICKRKTRGKFPAPLAPTVDHIIPLAVGGDHVYSNVQCACFSCNCRKQAGSANDQMRLAV